MPAVPARFRVGFEATAEYASLTDANKIDFKQAVETEIKARIGPTDLAGWNGLVIMVNAAGHKDEGAVQDDISSHLSGLKDPMGKPAQITIDPQAGVRYVVWDSTRECIHEYYLNRASNDWKVSKAYGATTVEVHLYGALAWDTAI